MGYKQIQSGDRVITVLVVREDAPKGSRPYEIPITIHDGTKEQGNGVLQTPDDHVRLKEYCFAEARKVIATDERFREMGGLNSFDPVDIKYF